MVVLLYESFTFFYASRWPSFVVFFSFFLFYWFAWSLTIWLVLWNPAVFLFLHAYLVDSYVTYRSMVEQSGMASVNVVGVVHLQITLAHRLCAFVNNGLRSLLYQLARAKKAASWIDSKFHSVLAGFNGPYKKETHVSLMKFRFSSSLRLCNWRSPFFNYKTDANFECKTKSYWLLHRHWKEAWNALANVALILRSKVVSPLWKLRCTGFQGVARILRIP